MKTSTKKVIAMGILALLICGFCTTTAFAANSDNKADTAVATEASSEETTAVDSASSTDNVTGSKAVAAAICVGLAAAAGALGMGIAIAKSSEGIARQPEASGNIRTNLMLGLVFIETAIIYALIIAILIIFVL